MQQDDIFLTMAATCDYDSLTFDEFLCSSMIVLDYNILYF
jgi:hypothetical protein